MTIGLSPLAQAYVDMEDARAELADARAAYGRHCASVRGEGKEPLRGRDEYCSEEIDGLSNRVAHFAALIREGCA